MTAQTAGGPKGTRLDSADLDSLPLAQRKRLQAMGRTCKTLTLGKRLKDGTLLLSGIPGWEQGRWATNPAGDRIFTRGYGRSCAWALGTDGTLYGQGWGQIPRSLQAHIALLSAPTQADREKLAGTSAGIRLQGTIRRAAERKERRQTRKPGARQAKAWAEAIALAQNPAQTPSAGDTQTEG